MKQGRCHRCGEPCRTNQPICSVCGAETSTATASTDFNVGAEVGTSNLFSVPTSTASPLVEMRHNQHEHARLLNWIAVGLMCVSILGGLLYHLYYLRVGDDVTALLPRDTSAYVRLGKTAVLETAFQNLNVWTTSRPVRKQMRHYEQALLTRQLFDVGLNYALLQRLKNDLIESHIAVVRTGQKQIKDNRLFFLRFRSESAAKILHSRLSPYFARAGEEAGIEYFVRRAGQTSISLASWDRLVVLCWGGDSALRDVLRSHDGGPSRSLNDEPGFRNAFREGGRRAGVWGYVTPKRLVTFLVERVFPRIVAPTKDDYGIQKATVLAQHTLVDSIGVSMDLHSGLDSSHISLYPKSTTSLKNNAKLLGAGAKRTLAAIPQESLWSIAIHFNNPRKVISEWSQPVVQLLLELGVIRKELKSDLNRLQAESGVYLARDIGANLAHEFAVAMVPNKTNDNASWLGVIQVHDLERAMTTAERLANYFFQDYSGLQDRVRFELKVDDNLYQLTQFTDDLISAGRYKNRTKKRVFCWTGHNSRILIAKDCSTVHRARRADLRGLGLDEDTHVTQALERLGKQETFLATANLRWLAEQFFGTTEVLELINTNFTAVTAVNVLTDRIDVSANISPLAAGFLWAMSVGNQEKEGGAQDPCRDLIDSICNSITSTDECAVWKEKVAGSSRQSCQTGLRTMTYLSEPESPNSGQPDNQTL